MGSTESFYGVTIDSFRNTIKALDIALENHFSSLILGDDLTRIIVADNAYAFRKRASRNDGNISLPFLNYYTTDINPSTDRFYWNHIANIEGIFSETLGRSIRIAPIRVSYESTLWINRYEDLLYAKQELIFDDSNETILYPTVEIEGNDLQIPAILGYNFNFRPNYTQNDWLENNNIQSIGLDFEFDYYMLKDVDNVSLSTTVCFDFINAKDPSLLPDYITNPEDMPNVQEIISSILDANSIVPQPIIPLGVSLNKNSVTLKAGETEQLIAKVSPFNADNKNVTWASSNEAIATVDSTGLVTGISDGSAIITVTTVEGGLTDTCNVTIDSTISVWGVSLNKNSLELDLIPSPESEQLIATVAPTSATDTSVTWLSSDPSIATVDGSGNVTAVSVGVCNIIVTTNDGGFTDTCVMTIINSFIPVTGVSFTSADPMIFTGDAFSVTPPQSDIATVEVLPVDAIDQGVTYTLTDNLGGKVSITPSGLSCTVDYNGGIVNLGLETTTLEVETDEGSFTDSIQIRLQAPF